jgi:hypothetical protein
MFTIYGRTFECKDTLKALGCRWNPAQKVWETGNPAAAAQAMRLPGVNVYGSADPSGPLEDLRIEYPSRGATYYDEEYGVYKYSRYPKSDARSGQQRRQFLGSYITLDLAKAAHPTAVLASSSGYYEPFASILTGE